jgi:hypothetical protein
MDEAISKGKVKRQAQRKPMSDGRMLYVKGTPGFPVLSQEER